MSNVEKIQYNLANILENFKNPQYSIATTTTTATNTKLHNNTNGTTSDDVYNNNNRNNSYYNQNSNSINNGSSSNNCGSSSSVGSNKPMNLMTNSSKFLQQQHFRNESKEHCAGLRSEEFSKPKQSLSSASSSSSGSPSIDVENDTEEDENCFVGVNKFDSAAENATTSNNIIIPKTQYPNPLVNMELTAASVPTGFPLNYQQMYASNAALYGAPVMFTGALHASYLAGLPLHAAMSPNESYLKAIQAAACGLYNPSVLAPTNLVNCKPPPAPLQQSHQSANNLHHPITTTSSMIALAPSANTIVGIPDSPQYSPNDVVRNKQDQANDSKKDYHSVPSSLATTHNATIGLSIQQQPSTLVTAATSTTTCTRLTPKGTYLQGKTVNERSAGAEAVTASNTTTQHDTHFKVPNGKEGSLKHRILRPPSNESSEVSKTPIMR